MEASSDIRLAGIADGRTVTIAGFRCSTRQLSRLAPLGLVRGVSLVVIRNRRKHALIVEAGRTTIALSRKVAENIYVGEPGV